MPQRLYPRPVFCDGKGGHPGGARNHDSIEKRDGGLRLLEQVRKEHKRVPVIFYTRKGTLEDVTVCLEAGALDVLRKPQPESLDLENDIYSQLEAAAMAHRDTSLSKFEALSSSTNPFRKLAKALSYVWKNWGKF